MGAYLLAAPLAFLVGISLGLLGGGGSTLAVPIFVYVLGLEPKSAIASSLIVVGLTSLVGATRHARHGNLAFGVGTLFGAAGLVGASLGSRVAALEAIPGNLLLIGFGGLMVVVAALMLRGRRTEGLRTAKSKPALALIGLGTGALTGLLGAGGGFLIVPALWLGAGLSMPRAMGTSLLIIAINCLAGLIGFLGAVPIHWSLAGLFAVASAAGSVVGASWARRSSPERLRRAFGWFVLAAGTAIILERLLN